MWPLARVHQSHDVRNCYCIEYDPRAVGSSQKMTKLMKIVKPQRSLAKVTHSFHSYLDNKQTSAKNVLLKVFCVNIFSIDQQLLAGLPFASFLHFVPAFPLSRSFQTCRWTRCSCGPGTAPLRHGLYQVCQPVLDQLRALQITRHTNTTSIIQGKNIHKP